MVSVSGQSDFTEKGHERHFWFGLGTVCTNPDILHCKWILYHLSHQESPKVLSLDIGCMLQVHALWKLVEGKPVSVNILVFMLYINF